MAKAKVEKTTVEKVVEVSATNEEPKAEVEEIKPAKESSKKTRKCEVNEHPYLLRENQPMLKSWRIVLPYFFAFFYNLILVVALAALFMLPYIKNPEYPELVSWIGGTGLGAKFSGLVSIFDIVMYKIKTMGGVDGLPMIISNLFGLVSFALVLVVLIIWFVIKLIHSLIALITCAFKHRRHHIVDGFFFKNTHQYYSLGILDFDFTFVVYLIYSILLLLFINIKAILGLIPGIPANVMEYINGVVAFKAFENSDVQNIGLIIMAVIVGVLIVVRIVYRIFVGKLSKKVKWTYVYDKKREKKIAKLEAKAAEKAEKKAEKKAEREELKAEKKAEKAAILSGTVNMASTKKEAKAAAKIAKEKN